MKDDEVENEKVFVCLSTVAKEEREKDGEFLEAMDTLFLPATILSTTLVVDFLPTHSP